MDDEEWNFFAMAVLTQLGYDEIERPARGPDGGSDGLVRGRHSHQTYVVSCKHYIRSNKAVGVYDEISISDRIDLKKANGFIGFYSTLPSTSLQNVFTSQRQRGRECFYYDRFRLASIIPELPTHLIQQYGSTRGIRYPLHVTEPHYHPLSCPLCGTDILNNNEISNSFAGIRLNQNQEWEYSYGHKKHHSPTGLVSHENDCDFWIELNQALHLEEILKWRSTVDEIINDGDRPVSESFWRNRYHFESSVLQRMYAPSDGKWI